MNNFHHLRLLLLITVCCLGCGASEDPRGVRVGVRGSVLLDGKPVDRARILFLPAEGENDVWEILRMGVLPEYRGAALSQQLLEAVIHQALAAGVTELRLAVRSEQGRLIDLYATYGFELAPELDYPHANPVEPPPHVMRRHLER